MDRLLIPLLGFLAVVIQTTLIPSIRVFSVAPDLIFLFVIFLALQRQNTLGIWVALAMGLLQDIAGGGLMGLNALVLLGVAYLALYLRRRFFQENMISQIILLVGFTFAHQFMLFFWMNILLGSNFPFEAWIERSFGMCIYHVLLGPILYSGLRRIIRPKEIENELQHWRNGSYRKSHLERLR